MNGALTWIIIPVPRAFAEAALLRCMSPEMAPSRRAGMSAKCLLVGGKRTRYAQLEFFRV
jgi:hypothetical protein